MNANSSRRSALTLVEVLVVMAILLNLVAIIVPGVAKVREAADRIKCANNIRQIVLAAHNAHDSFSYIPSNPDTLGR
jgi:type II secretory pathway pseudopilin PulG